MFTIFFSAEGYNRSYIRYSPSPLGAYLLGEDKVEHIKSDYKVGI